MTSANGFVSCLGAALIALPMLSGAARAGVLQVPAQFPTIQAAIDAANAGDEVVVAPGLYPERIDLLGKAITVRGSGGSSVTTIDGGGAGSTVTFRAETTSAHAQMQGFTITGGTGTVEPSGAGIDDLVGGGVFIDGAAPALADLVITGNSAARGGGVMIAFSQTLVVTLHGCTIAGNIAGSSGGGVMVWSSTATLDDCTLQDNAAAIAGGGLSNQQGHVILKHSTVAGNSASSGGGVHSASAAGDGPGLLVQDCLLRDNHAGVSGGGLSASVQGEFPFLFSFARVESCRFLGNAAPTGAAVEAAADPFSRVDLDSCLVAGSGAAGASAVAMGSGVFVDGCTVVDNAGPGLAGDAGGAVFGIAGCIVRGNGGAQLQGVPAEWSDIEGGWPGTGNVDVDPLFVDATGGDYHLQRGSPCQDSGKPGPAFVELDLDGEARVQGGRVDIGCDEVTADCNGNGQADYLDIAAGLSGDCDLDGVPDECVPFVDCDGNGILDNCDIHSGAQEDCNGNGVPDACDLRAGTSLDADGDGVPDECEDVLMVPGEFPTIQAAIDAAANHDTIGLADGVYSGEGNVNLHFNGKPLLLTSLGGKEHCRVDGLHQSRLASLGAADHGVLIRGLTVADCSGTTGGALLVDDGASVDVSDCSFTGNMAGLGGGAALVRGGASAAFTRCVFAGNSASAGGGVRVTNATATLESCTFSGNKGVGGGSKGGSVAANVGADVLLRDVILRGGTAVTGHELFVEGAGTLVTLSFSDVQGGLAGVGTATGGSVAWGAGMIDADPLFKDAAVGDFRLSGGSPCIDSGDPSAPLDADGTPADMGAIPFVGWEDLGFALAGVAGAPSLAGEGTLLPGEKVTLTLSGAAPHAAASLILGGSTLFASFKGGTLVPAFEVLLPGPVTDGAGSAVMSGRWPVQAPPGYTVFLQSWIADAAAPAGFSASNGLAGETR